jgi:hypothetical protein
LEYVPVPETVGYIDPLQLTIHTPAVNINEQIATTVPVVAVIVGSTPPVTVKYPPNWFDDGSEEFGEIVYVVGSPIFVLN